MIQLTTKRLRFRQWLPEDAPRLYAHFKDERFTRFIGGAQNPESVWRLLAAYVGHYQWKGYSYLPVETKEGQLIGSVGLWHSDPWPELELGYWFLPEFQGQGYAKEAAQAVWNYALTELEVLTLISLIHHNNKASIRLAEKLGALYEKDIELLSFGTHGVWRYLPLMKLD
ncbi:MAG: GNAT family N-acetyltransferase [Bacteroidota bacterium]